LWISGRLQKKKKRMDTSTTPVAVKAALLVAGMMALVVN